MFFGYSFPKFACVLCCVVLVGGGCATIRKFNPLESKTLEARRLTREAESAMYESDLAAAESMLVSAIERDPTDNRSRAVLAEVLWSRGAQKAAVEQMARAVSLSGRRDADQITQLGQMLLTSGNHTAALHRAEEAIQLDASSADAWTLKGFAHKKQGDQKAALAAFFRSLSIRDDDPQTRAEIAKIYQQLGEPQRALSILGSPQDENFQNCPHFHEICYLRGVLLRELERPSDAIAALQSARENGCQANDLLFHLADAQLALGEVLKARATLTEASVDCAPELQVALAELQQRVDARLPAANPVWR